MPTYFLPSCLLSSLLSSLLSFAKSCLTLPSRAILYLLVLQFAGNYAIAASPARNAEKTFAKLHDLVAQRAAKEAESAELSAKSNGKQGQTSSSEDANKLQLATFGNGCFWCTEAVFEEVHGVDKVVSGYSGGRNANPTYQQVCTGLTGHAEVIHLRYDPKQISYGKLLEVFFRTHDPTTLNRQGPDHGTQYRSAIFYHSEEQREIAQLFKAELNTAKAFRSPVVTEIVKFKKFYRAENYHQDYFELHGRAPYCQNLIRPKLTKFRRAFREDLAAVVEKKQKREAKKEKGKTQ